MIVINLRSPIPPGLMARKVTDFHLGWNILFLFNNLNIFQLHLLHILFTH